MLCLLLLLEQLREKEPVELRHCSDEWEPDSGGTIYSASVGISRSSYFCNALRDSEVLFKLSLRNKVEIICNDTQQSATPYRTSIAIIQVERMP